ncbi:hypothetical protein [Dethiosulfatarculus sandiegensis]|uniref:Uncharacterized protein n=1 Tax=Dethiosulfatarculus sandiegensis TaxID=1429043 RepID=A0A0D2JAQ9_9BACT|nr:hypothetical protein [Dethiosulfatarculus sandiegensis]KIX15219.1 hypothetical protein X474_05060 [Dethiosulfatarculus sandiegensis]
MKNKEAFRWLAWAATMALLIWAGASLWHLKHMELFLLLFTAGNACLVVLFRFMREKP